MKISDLHSNNLKVRSIETEQAEIVPIDLESIQPGKTTGLCTNSRPDLPKLTPAELEVIAKFESRLKSIPFRFIPLRTGYLEGAYNEITGYNRIGEALIKDMKQENFTFTCTDEEIKMFILKDFLNGDLPYLTSFQDEIYFGLAGRKHIIARKKK